MSKTIRFRRGLEANLPTASGTALVGEPRFSTDTGRFYIDGGGTLGNVRFYNQDDVDTLISNTSGTLQTQFDNLDLDYASDAQLTTVSNTLQSQIDNKDHNDLVGLQGGASSEYYHLDAATYSGIYSTSSGIGIGSSSGSNFFVNTVSDTTVATVDSVAVISLTDTEQVIGQSGVSTLTLQSTGAVVTVSGTDEVTITEAGMALSAGTSVNEFSTDVNLAGDSDNAVPTEHAVKTYVDNHTWTESDITDLQDYVTEAEFTTYSGTLQSQITTNATDLSNHANGTGADHTYINQNVTSSGNPTFTGGIDVGTSSTVELKVETGSTSEDPYSLGFNLASHRITFLSEEGTNMEALQFGDASNTTGTIFGVSASVDSGSTWLPAIKTTLGRATTIYGTLALTNGTSINEFSTDGTLAGDSDDASPTEKAVKTYVDTHANGTGADHTYIDQDVTSSASPTFSGLAVNGDVDLTGNSSSQLLLPVGSVSAPAIQLGDNAIGFYSANNNSVDVVVKSGLSTVRMATFDGSPNSGLKLYSGASVNEFSTDGTLAGDSDIAVPTEKAVKTYVDAVSGTLQTQVTSNTDAIANLGDTYYTESEVDTLLSGKSDTGHTHDDRYYTETELTNGQLDTRYYTESEVDALFSSTSGTLQDQIDILDDTFATDAELTAVSGSLQTDIVWEIVDTPGEQIRPKSSHITKALYHGGNLTIAGNLTVSGTTTTVHSTEVTVSDKVITVNADEVGAGITGSSWAGIEIERGSADNYFFIFDETQDVFRIGVSGTGGNATQAVATREDSPNDGYFATWDQATLKFVTTNQASDFATAGHNHDSSYYTETELDNGQLDNRYYTETEVDALFSTTSGTLQSQIDTNAGDISTNAGNISTNTTDIAANTAMITATSGTLQGQIDSLGDTYYTETELDNGQLDNRYYTESEVDTISGSLSSEIDSDISTHSASGDHDGRYYTETELDNGQLDNRYYTETEVDALFSTTSGTLQSQIDTNAGDISTNAGNISTNTTDIAANTAMITATSGTLQGQIDSLGDTYYTETEIDALVGSGIGTGTDNYMARYDGTQAVQAATSIVVGDDDQITGVAGITIDNIDIDGSVISTTAGDLTFTPVGSIIASTIVSCAVAPTTDNHLTNKVYVDNVDGGAY